MARNASSKSAHKNRAIPAIRSPFLRRLFNSVFQFLQRVGMPAQAAKGRIKPRCLHRIAKCLHCLCSHPRTTCFTVSLFTSSNTFLCRNLKHHAIFVCLLRVRHPIPDFLLFSTLPASSNTRLSTFVFHMGLCLVNRRRIQRGSCFTESASERNTST